MTLREGRASDRTGTSESAGEGRGIPCRHDSKTLRFVTSASSRPVYKHVYRSPFRSERGVERSILLPWRRGIATPSPADSLPLVARPLSERVLTRLRSLRSRRPRANSSVTLAVARLTDSARHRTLGSQFRSQRSRTFSLLAFGGYPSSSARSNWLTSPGSALPPVFCMTCPTRKLIAPSSPDS